MLFNKDWSLLEIIHLLTKWLSSIYSVLENTHVFAIITVKIDRIQNHYRTFYKEMRAVIYEAFFKFDRNVCFLVALPPLCETLDLRFLHREINLVNRNFSFKRKRATMLLFLKSNLKIMASILSSVISTW